MITFEDLFQRTYNNARIGVFGGYKLYPGYVWRGEYLAWDIEDFVNESLSKTATTLSRGIANPHVTRICRLTDGGLFLPLEAQCEQENSYLGR